MTIISERPAGTKDVVVSTRILRPSGPPIDADWRVRTTGERYRIIDVMVEGVSMVITQRSEFAAVVQRHGLQGLIEVLRARTTKLPAVAAAK
jgi:phospholipid transport system substrate-binding protein